MTPLHHIKKLHRFYVLAVFLLAFFLRIYLLDGQALRGDEAASVHYAALPVKQLWELSSITDPHPPLYYLLLHPWQWLLGEDAWVMRFAGVVASVLSVAVLYQLSRRTLPSIAVSLLAATLLAVNPLQIWLAQDIRSYPFFTLLGLLSSWALWEALHGGQLPVNSKQLSVISGQWLRGSHQESRGNDTDHGLRTTFPWPLYIIATVACLYIHYYTVFLIAFQGLFVLINARRFWSKRWPWLASQGAIGLLIIPGLQLAYNFIGQAAGGIDTIPTGDILRQASTALLTGFTLDSSSGLWVSLLLAPIWLIGIIALLRRDWASGSFWVLFFAIPVLGVIALSIGRPFFKERFLIQAQPAFELLLATGFLTLAGQRWSMNDERQTITHQHTAHRTPHTAHYALRTTSALALVALLYANFTAFTNYHTDPAYAKAPPWHLYHDYVSDHAQPGDVMLTNFPEAAVSYYSPNDLPFYVVPDERDLPTSARLTATANIAGAYKRIWFLPLLRQGFDEQGDVLGWLDRHADRVDQTFFPVYNINLYLSPSTIDAHLIPQLSRFDHGIHLRGYQILDKSGQSRLTFDQAALPTLTLKPDDDFTLSLYWQADGSTAVPYTVFTHLIAADGFNRTGQDNQPVWGTYPTTAWQPDERITDKYTLTLPPGTPPGDHHLRVGWYQSDTGERIPIVDAAGQPLADHVVLDVVVRVEARKE